MAIIFKDEVKQNAKAVVPIAILVLILNLFRPVDNKLIGNFLLGCLGVILGLSIFLTGVDLSISKIGSFMGDFIAKSENILKVVIFGIFIGFIISVAEPDLLILANQVSSAVGLVSFLIVAIISAGVGVMISIGLYRIFKEIKLSSLMIVVYGVIFILMLITNDLGHAIAFDASGATTGAMTTPFIIALGLGVSKLKGESKGEENSFGLVGIASAGPILAGLLMSLSIDSSNVLIEEMAHTSAIYSGFKSATFAIVPISLVFFVMDKLVFKIKNKKNINLGLIYTYLGLIIFLASVEGGFMELARVMGENYADFKLVPLIGFILGLLVVLAEPAVFVLSEQVEEVTGGSIHKSSIMKALSLGVAFAVMLAMFRIKIEGFKLWMLIVPGFLLALILSRNVPQLFVGIAFDSGGVASGPMTATFILAFCQGVAGNVADGFGVIAFVALMPVITIMIMGSFYKEAIEG
ncbi:DUF1538 domain-containing protein [Anaerococcus hydrogenalis]|uniref:DUF1538 domain-containing protein n=1 Tax=Anaerococcus hydrogenalis TaxID=33029 RepID=A0A2N6UHJ8_9FIRM|nr:DUF1538 domain-containing protein [Anaerococcus hydrogenalis]MDK7695531.1 DUF1538 domain-containing protein [Anaerococcus hydrogenalis]MDK7697239.1 DUF1538 domain-containing protein [Anaerococcus hydrogenalis]MDK7708558.1 DUF1538 domain-containing protein [Anaerococcus hydrogenalis]PMC81008.1 DUF1538 domain-containing protein [Anaerococcus hydrogenalis]